MCACARSRARVRSRVIVCVSGAPGASVRLCVARGALRRGLVLCFCVLGPRIPVSPFVFMVACMRVRGATRRGVVWRGGGW